jgi:hypothetical protein
LVLPRPILPLLVVTLLFGFLPNGLLRVDRLQATETKAGDLKLRIELAWGTDGTPPEGKSLKELDAKGREKLRHFRWKNYWVVKSTSVALDARIAQSVPLDRCQVDLKTTPNGQLEVRLNSVTDAKQLKLIKTLQHSPEALKRGEFLIIAGDDKDNWNDAWFVIIRGEHGT